MAYINGQEILFSPTITFTGDGTVDTSGLATKAELAQGISNANTYTDEQISDLAKSQNEYLATTLTQFETYMDEKHASKSELEQVDNYATEHINDIEASIGDIETALDSIISIQNSLIGGGN